MEALFIYEIVEQHQNAALPGAVSIKFALIIVLFIDGAGHVESLNLVSMFSNGNILRPCTFSGIFSSI